MNYIKNNTFWLYLLWSSFNIITDSIINNQWLQQSHNWIDLINWNNNIIEKINTYNNSIWINISKGNYNIVKDIYSYNNTLWYNFEDLTDLYVNNIQWFNNSSIGVYLYSWSYITINNSQFYNNWLKWISLSNSSYNIINNTQIYNNNYGLDILKWGNNYFNNIKVVNNNNWFWSLSTLNNYYYGNLTHFWNDNIKQNKLLSDWLIKWTDNYLWFLNWNNITIWTFDCNLHSNPNNFFSSPFDSCLTKKLQQIDLPLPITYFNYWVNILKQVKPLKWNGYNFIPFGNNWTDYNDSKFIWEQ